MLPNLIGLYSAVPQSGKTTVAMLLEENFGFVRMSFADTLKDMLEPLYRDIGYPDGLEQLSKEEPIADFFNLSPRHLMQTLGTEWGRSLSNDFWIEIMGRRLKHQFKVDHHSGVVIDDLRFVNEYGFIKHFCLRAELWKISGPFNVYGGSHSSEGNLTGHMFDFNLANTGSIEDLASKIRARIESI
jgi:hypothetical protein